MTTTSSFVSTLATLAASLLRNSSVLMAASPVVWDEVVSRHLLLIKWVLAPRNVLRRYLNATRKPSCRDFGLLAPRACVTDPTARMAITGQCTFPAALFSRAERTILFCGLRIAIVRDHPSVLRSRPSDFQPRGHASRV